MLVANGNPCLLQISKRLCPSIIIPFHVTSESLQPNEHDVINWIIDNQLARRNINDDQKACLIGKRYQEEKKEEGRPLKDRKLGNRYPVIGQLEDRSSNKIAEQTNVSEKTVRNAEKFANAVDTVAENAGINPQKILSGEINAFERI